jgi:hypothetical protein
MILTWRKIDASLYDNGNGKKLVSSKADPGKGAASMYEYLPP